MTSKARSESQSPAHPQLLLYYFCRVQLPEIPITIDKADLHLARTFQLFSKKNSGASFEAFIKTLYALDWFLASACLDGHARAWEYLFSARATRPGLLIDRRIEGTGRSTLSSQ